MLASSSSDLYPMPKMLDWMSSGESLSGLLTQTKNGDRVVDTVLISGVYGTGNLGDEKILSGLAHLCKDEYNGVSVIASSINPDITERRAPVDKSIPTIERDPKQWLTIISSVDLIILGGGTTIGPMTSQRHSFVVAIAEVLGIEIYVISGAAEGQKVHLEAAKRYLKCVDALVTRDFRSKRFLQSMGISEPLSVLPDPGFVNTGPPKEISPNLPDQYVIVSVRHVEWKENDVDISGIAEGLDKINKENPHSIVFLPFHRGVDEEFSKKIMREMQTESQILTQEFSISEYEYIISTSDALVGMRLHSMILAAHLRTAFTPISYHEKCDGFLELIGIDECIEYDSVDSCQLFNKVQKNLDTDAPYSKDSVNNAIESQEENCSKILKSCELQDRPHSRLQWLNLLIYLPVVVAFRLWEFEIPRVIKRIAG